MFIKLLLPLLLCAYVSVQAQIPVWQHIPVVPSADYQLFSPSNTKQTLYSHNATNRLNVWNEKTKSWDIDFDNFINCNSSSGYPTLCLYGKYLMMINTCFDRDYFSYDTSSLLYRDTVGIWHFSSLPDTLNQLQKQYGQNIKIWVTGMFSGTDNNLYIVCGYDRRDPWTLESVAREFFIYSKKDINAQWERRKNLHPKFVWSENKYFSFVHWKDENNYILSNKDSVFIHEDGSIKTLPTLNYDGQLFFEYHNGSIYVQKGELYRYEDSVWRELFPKPVYRYIVNNDKEIYCYTPGNKSWNYDHRGTLFGDSLYKTIDGGKTWTYVSSYFCPLHVGEDGYMYGTYFSPRTRIARSRDEGKSIEIIEKGLEYSNEIFSIQAQQDGSVLACGPGLWRSTDDGESWHSLGLDTFYVRNAFIDQKGYIHVSLESDSFPQYRDRGQVAVRSTDNGRSWYLQHYAWDNWGGFTQSPDGTIYSLPTRYSRDDGKTWNKIVHTEKVKYLNDPKEYEEYLAGGLPAFLGKNIVLLPNPLSRSTDGGHTWKFLRRPPRAQEPLYPCYSVLYDPLRQRFIAFVSEGSYYSYISVDSGKTWQKISENPLPLNNGTLHSVIDSTGRIYAYQTESSWAIYSDDGGLTWIEKQHHVNAGSPMYSNITKMTVSKRGFIYHIDKVCGLYRTTERYPPVGIMEENDIVEKPTITIAPNPADNTITIIGADNVLNDFRITDITGRIMYEGRECIIDISAWAQGMYALTLQKNNSVITHTFCIVR